MPPLVSILVPAYNAAEWLSETLECAVTQDYPNTEVIVVNDGSTDETLRIARRFESRSVKVINQENGGGPAARNRAFAAAQGEYVQWLDHDDLLDHDKISGQVKALQRLANDRILLLSPFAKFYYSISGAKREENVLFRDLSPSEYFFIKFSQDAWVQTACWLASRKVSERAGPWWEVRSPDDDGEYFCRMVKASEGIRFVNGAGAYWRVGNASSFSYSRAHSRVALEAFWKSIRRCVDHYLTLEDTERARSACGAFLRARLIYFYPEHRDLVAEIRSFAQSFGGTASLPSVSWKLRIASGCIGWRAAKVSQQFLSGLATSGARGIDRFRYALNRKLDLQ